MSNKTLHQHARVRLDAAVRRGLASLCWDPRAQARFLALLDVARARSTLVRPAVRGGRDLRAVGALVRIARLVRAHVHRPGTWPGSDQGLYRDVGSLASHVLGGYRTPAILDAVWLSPDNRQTRQYRRWFIEHARGRPFRRIADLPIVLTRRMEHLFLQAAPHQTVLVALRRAEVVGLGGSEALADTIARTHLGRTLQHGAFWRTVLLWLRNHEDALDRAAITELVAMIDRVRFGARRAADDGLGIHRGAPLHPTFSIAGRTPASLRRWLLGEGMGPRPRSTEHGWRPLGVPGLAVRWEEPDRTTGQWEIVELVSAPQLRAEGRRLHHCVGSYVRNCVAGRSSIWSLRRRCPQGKLRSAFTIEVCPRRRAVVQIRGQRNRRVDGTPAQIIHHWARRAGLTLQSGA